jgi:hypothetical protein
MKPELPSSVCRRIGALRLRACLTACAAGMLVVPSPALAQMVMNGVEHLSFDRPESWALKYFTSASLLSGLETPRTVKPGALSIGLEIGSLPPLTDAQQLVGYNGTEAQDLNKAPFFLRPRVEIGLPARLSLIVAVVPPVRMFGIKPKMLALALQRPIYETPSWAVGLRAYGQVGTVQGSYTCPESALAFEPGTPGNVDGCQAASSDTASLRYAGGEVSVAYGPDAPHRFSPHAAIGITYMDVAFQVGALTFGMIDHTRYFSHGVTASLSGGVSYRLTARLSLGMDVFYTPLSVRRGLGAPVQNDGLFNVRGLVSYRLH